MTSDAEGSNPDAVQALAQPGWEVRPADVLTSDDPMSALEKPNLVAIVATVASGSQVVANQRIVYPVLDRGAIANVLVLKRGTVIAQHLVPIDRTLPSDLSVLSEPTAAPPAVIIDHAAAPSTACAACHQTAHHAWSDSAHARALNSLSITDQTTSCAICHTTSLPGRNERAPGVGCTACHQGGAAHLAGALRGQAERDN